MKILFAVFQTDNHSNGGVKSISKIMECFPPPSVYVITNRTTPRTVEWKTRNFCMALDQRASKSPLSRLGNIIRFNWKTFRLIKEKKIDIVHCNDPAPFFMIFLAAILARRPIIYNLRDTLDKITLKRRITYPIQFLISKYSLFLSRDMVNRYQSTFRLPAPTGLYSIFDHPNTKASKPTHNDLPKFAYIGATCDKKNQLEFIVAAKKRYKDTPPPYEIIFAGDHRPERDMYANECEDELKHSNLSRHLRFIGHQKDIAYFLARIDGSILCSRKEGLARSLIEPLFFGVPFVSFDVCSAHEIAKQGPCGIVCEQGDYDAVFRNLDLLASSAELRSHLSAKALEIANTKLSKERSQKKHRFFYKSIFKFENGQTL